MGRSPPRRTPKIAVESGNRPMKTIECAEVDVLQGQRRQQGEADDNTERHHKQVTADPVAPGRRCRGKTGAGRGAKMPAMAARATVRNTGSKACTATRVAGSEPLKMTTPANPLIQPAR